MYDTAQKMTLGEIDEAFDRAVEWQRDSARRG
jgi:hypothetical protein